jgi:hypothetical protein
MVIIMNILDHIKESLPSEVSVSSVRFEGSEIVIYTGNREFFMNPSKYVKSLVSELKKRIIVRPDQSISMDQARAKEKIFALVPPNAEIESIVFEPCFGRVVIEAKKPGLVIGKGGITLDRIKRQLCWMPVVKRAPPIKSDIVKSVRKIMHANMEQRKEFLHKIGEKIHPLKPVSTDWLRVTALGGFREVGRSCLFIQTPASRVLLDCGLKPAGGFPYLQVPEFDMSQLDAIIITHPHLDHVGFVPYLYEHGFEGPVYCTKPVRDTAILLCLDYLDVAQREGGEAPYSSRGIEGMIKQTITLDYGEVTDITQDIRLTLQNAGHILGSAIAHLHIGEGLHNILYTSDFNFGPSRLFDPAFTAWQRVETLIIESTYGGSEDIQPNRADAEKKLVKIIKDTTAKGGKVIIPVFAVGRSQEVMCVLSEQDIDFPVYLEGMLWDATAIHTAYPEYLTKKLQEDIFHRQLNPFTSDIFKRVGSSEEREEVINTPGPAVILTTSGMLVGGPVLEYLKALADDKKNCLLFVGYQAKGTLGRRIQHGWREVPLRIGTKRETIKIKLQVETVEGLSGHSDYNQLISFVNKLPTKPNKIIANHGDNTKCIELASSLYKLFRCETIAPRNLETIRLV